jgi:glyoxylase-like metal-dependent hydrolase (beta-lactamase superfamily II)
MPRIRSYCGGFTQTNGYLIESSTGTKVMVDAPSGLEEWLESEGITPDILLLTHAHFDHVADAAQIQERFGCAIKAFSDPDPDLTLESAYKGLGVTVDPYSVAEHLGAGDIVTVGDLSFECLHVPGHSPDSLCFLLRSNEAGDPTLVFGGDVLFQGSVGRTDFPHGNHEQLIRGIREQLFALPDDTVVFPGHGDATSIGAEKMTNPYAGLQL